jgi:hypothetical protein
VIPTRAVHTQRLPTLEFQTWTVFFCVVCGSEMSKRVLSLLKGQQGQVVGKGAKLKVTSRVR